MFPVPLVLALFLCADESAPAPARDATIVGTTAQYEGSSGTADVEVVLVAKAADGVPESPRFPGRVVVATTRSDDKGSFVFEGLSPGKYELHAPFGPYDRGVLLDVEMAAKQRRRVTLELKNEHDVIGALVAPGAAFDTCRLLAFDPAVDIDTAEPLNCASFGKDGGFVFPNMPVGTYRLAFALSDFQVQTDGFGWVPGRGMRRAFALVEVDSKPQTRATIDVRNTHPGTFLFHTNPEPFPQTSLLIYAAGKHERPVAAASADAEGLARLSGIFAGDYEVVAVRWRVGVATWDRGPIVALACATVEHTVHGDTIPVDWSQSGPKPKFEASPAK